MTEQENRLLNDKFMLRLPDGMRERIKAAADENRRSMNAEIIARLEISFRMVADAIRASDDADDDDTLSPEVKAAIDRDMEEIILTLAKTISAKRSK